MYIRTYGCSFTNYLIGTYADILKCDHTVINQGLSGSGNDYIKHTLITDYKNNLLNNVDLVVVQWSGFTRWNYMTRKKQWIGLDGSIYNRANKESRRALKHVRSFYNVLYEQERFVNDIIIVKGFLDSLGIQNCILSLEKTDLDFVTVDNIAVDYKGDYVFESGQDWITETTVDDHPTLLSHLQIAKQIAPVSDTTDKIVETVDNKIRQTKVFADYRLELANRNIAACG